jgi:plasmid stabilization system protein ParE
MKWEVVARPQVEDDIREAAEWYNAHCAGLGNEFTEEILTVFDALEINPLLHCRRHPTKNIRWRYPDRFPYRVIYEVIEAKRSVIIAAVLHAARQDSVWRRRL